MATRWSSPGSRCPSAPARTPLRPRSACRRGARLAPSSASTSVRCNAAAGGRRLGVRRPARRTSLIGPDFLLPLWQRHAAALRAEVRSFALPRFGLTFEDRAYQMGVINLSPELVHLARPACRSSRRSTTAGAWRSKEPASSTSAPSQPVLRAPGRRRGAGRTAGRVVSALSSSRHRRLQFETYVAGVTTDALGRGAAVINLTGRPPDDEIYELVARHDAAVIICFTPVTISAMRSTYRATSWSRMSARLFRGPGRARDQSGRGEDLAGPGDRLLRSAPDGPGRVRYAIEHVAGVPFQEHRLAVCMTLSPVAMFKEEVRWARPARHARAPEQGATCCAVTRSRACSRSSTRRGCDGRKHRREPRRFEVESLELTITILLTALFAAGLANWRERRPRPSRQAAATTTPISEFWRSW